MNAEPLDRPRVFAASAALRLLFGEPGVDRIEVRLAGAYISALSFHEVLAKLGMAGITPAQAEMMFGELEIEIVPLDRAQIVLGSRFRALTRQLGLSFGDCTCLALAHMRSAIALTADPVWCALELGIDIEAIQ